MLTKYFDPGAPGLLIRAPHDDAALWRGDRFVVATTDTMAEDVDFRLAWPGFDYRLLGRRLLSISLSDLAGMGAEPRYALMSLALRPDLSIGDVDSLYAGIAERAQQFSCAIAGGDLSETRGPLVLTATLIGRLRYSSQVLRRAGARPGWQIAVTGTLGGAAAGLRMLEDDRPPRTAHERAWVQAQLDPVPQIKAGRLLVGLGVRVGGDISDGLYREVERLVEPSGLGATIDVGSLPLAGGIRADEWALAVSDSEDFELICAGPAARIGTARSALKRQKISLTIVGEVDRTPGIRFKQNGRLVELERAGYEHFR
ncbi:MAG TPA: thiamine-phosphate kinase [Candidatus Dormibacteraeota bacterium]